MILDDLIIILAAAQEVREFLDPKDEAEKALIDYMDSITTATYRIILAVIGEIPKAKIAKPGTAA